VFVKQNLKLEDQIFDRYFLHRHILVPLLADGICSQPKDIPIREFQKHGYGDCNIDILHIIEISLHEDGEDVAVNRPKIQIIIVADDSPTPEELPLSYLTPFEWKVVTSFNIDIVQGAYEPNFDRIVFASQNGKPIAFYSRKMNSTQCNYTTTEKELLSIVATLKEFRNILLGQRITVYTDHKNLTYTNFNTERVMRWRLVIEEFGPELRYIKGESNVVADALSRLKIDDETEIFNVSECFGYDDDDLPPSSFPIRYIDIATTAQKKDVKLQQKLASHKDFSKTTFCGGDKAH
jgi:hypothetical protein